MTEGSNALQRGQPASIRALNGRDLICVCALLALTLSTRLVNRGTPYFVDGPRIIYAIITKIYAIQSPGYWAFAHLGGLFRNPAIGLAFWNVAFSALGIPVFYLLCRLKRDERFLCFLTAFAFSSIYFVWFAGEIHSSYASQILFPPLSIYCFLRSDGGQKEWWVAGWALSAAVGMALRPSDGVFLLPLGIYLLLRYVKQPKVRVIFVAINAAVFLGWYIPTRHAMAAMPYYGTTGDTVRMSMRTVSPLVIGINARSLANASRVIVPLLVAFWPLLPSIFSKRDRKDSFFGVFWMLPGLCFFLLCYMADPTYLVFLSGACFWLVMTSFNTRRALACLIVCSIFNTGLFLGARPMASSGLTHKLINFYVVKYCRYGIKHQWSSTIGDGAVVP